MAEALGVKLSVGLEFDGGGLIVEGMNLVEEEACLYPFEIDFYFSSEYGGESL